MGWSLHVLALRWIGVVGLAFAQSSIEPSPGALELRPPNAMTLRRTFTRELRLLDDSLRYRSGSNDAWIASIGVEALGLGTIGLRDFVPVERSERIVVRDVIRGSPRSAPLWLERSYVELGGTDLWPPDPVRRELGCPELGDAVVVLPWETVTALGFVQVQDERKVGSVLSLEADLDLRAWLPPRAVVPGDIWGVPPQALRSLLEPAGLDLSTQGEFPRVLPETLRLDGTIRASLIKRLGTSGRELALVRFHAAVHCRRELRYVQSAIVGYTKVEGEVRTRFDLRGEILWDLHGGHLHSFDLRGSATVEGDAVDIQYRRDNTWSVDVAYVLYVACSVEREHPDVAREGPPADLGRRAVPAPEQSRRLIPIRRQHP